MDIIVQHTVRDYDTWKPAFDEHEPTRAKYGCKGHTIYRDPDNRNEITVITSWSHARAPSSSFGTPRCRRPWRRAA